MPVFSLPSDYGVGDFGNGAYRFVDFLEKAGQSVWQILPLVQTGYGDSPYSSVCSYSFNPYFISPELLLEKGLLTEEETEFTKSANDGDVSYGELYAVRYPMLQKAFLRFDKNDAGFKAFVKKGRFYNYALYMALKFASGQKHFYEWEDKYRYRNEDALKEFAEDYKDEILYWQFIQYIAQEQWLNLKRYANSKNVSIVGDIPLYVALDSVDVWENPSLFKLYDDFKPKKVAGVPPDYFCADGQLWGNPVYDYAHLKENGYSWWAERIANCLKIFDYVRIDHFRGLDRYYEIDADAQNARNGVWVDVPSDELFEAIHKKANKNRIIAEDLGIIDDGVRELRKKLGYPGMKILSFAFDGCSDNLYLPENIDENSVCYTGTHDNDTLMGLIESASSWDYTNLFNGVVNSLTALDVDGKTDTREDLARAIIELGFKCAAKTFIMPMQDVLLKDGSYRINRPGVVGKCNWSVRFKAEDFTDETAAKLLELSEKYGRAAKRKE